MTMKSENRWMEFNGSIFISLCTSRYLDRTYNANLCFTASNINKQTQSLNSEYMESGPRLRFSAPILHF